MPLDVGAALSGLRHSRKKSQRAAAQELGISQALLSHYENGLREPRLEFIVRACSYYGVSADYLFGRTEAPVNPLVGGDGAAVPESVCSLTVNVSDTVSCVCRALGDAAAPEVEGYITAALCRLLADVGISPEGVASDTAAHLCAAKMELAEARLASKKAAPVPLPESVSEMLVKEEKALAELL